MATPLPNERFLHEHYKYKLKFNSISKTNSRSPCDTSSQLKLKHKQSDKQYWIANPDAMYLAFVGHLHCCSVETVAETKQASSATASRTFPVDVVPSELHLGLNSVPTFHHIQPGFMNLFDNQVVLMKTMSGEL